MHKHINNKYHSRLYYKPVATPPVQIKEGWFLFPNIFNCTNAIRLRQAYSIRICVSQPCAEQHHTHATDRTPENTARHQKLNNSFELKQTGPPFARGVIRFYFISSVIANEAILSNCNFNKLVTFQLKCILFGLRWMMLSRGVIS